MKAFLWILIFCSVKAFQLKTFSYIYGNNCIHTWCPGGALEAKELHFMPCNKPETILGKHRSIHKFYEFTFAIVSCCWRWGHERLWTGIHPTHCHTGGSNWLMRTLKFYRGLERDSLFGCCWLLKPIISYNTSSWQVFSLSVTCTYTRTHKLSCTIKSHVLVLEALYDKARYSTHVVLPRQSQWQWCPATIDHSG